MKSVHFLEKKFPMTKKKRKRRQNFFRELKGTFIKDFFLKIYFQKIFAPPMFVTQIFAPPIFMTSLRPCVGLLLGQRSSRNNVQLSTALNFSSISVM